MSKKIEKLKDDFFSVCNSIVATFCKKQELDFDGWVSGEVNGLALFSGQYYFSLNEIMLDLTKNQAKGFILEWQEAGVEFNIGLENQKHINYLSYIMGARYDMIAGDNSLKESINHPMHYGGENDTYETIKVIEAWEMDFIEGNILKYLRRYKKKNGLEDLQKSLWYLEYLINKYKSNDKQKRGITLGE